MSIALSIPTDFGQLVPWLERQIVGLQLNALVSDLAVLHHPNGRIHLQDICADRLNEVLESGIGVLEPDEISRLLCNPQTLIELQELAFLSGSEFWGQLASGGEAGRRSESLKASILSQLKPIGHDTTPGFSMKTDPGLTALPPVVHVPAPREQPVPVDEPISRAQVPASEVEQEASQTTHPSAETHANRSASRRTGRIMAALAAALLIAVAVKVGFPTAAPQGWGFNRPDLLAFEGSEPDFLNHLADRAGEWSKKPVTDREQLKTRISQYATGCEKLIASLSERRVTQLSEVNRTWLLETCRSELDELKALHVALEAETISFEDARKRADQLSVELVALLRNRATVIL
ncbi:MAG: hypothetical protein R3C49_26115 [Planctomycetaceae bacterium]